MTLSLWSSGRHSDPFHYPQDFFASHLSQNFCQFDLCTVQQTSHGESSIGDGSGDRILKRSNTSIINRHWIIPASPRNGRKQVSMHVVVAPLFSGRRPQTESELHLVRCKMLVLPRASTKHGWTSTIVPRCLTVQVYVVLYCMYDSCPSPIIFFPSFPGLAFQSLKPANPCPRALWVSLGTQTPISQLENRRLSYSRHSGSGWMRTTAASVGSIPSPTTK